MIPETRVLPVIGACIGDGRFELLAKLGEGGMSVVFRTQDHQLGREVALKLLLPRYLGRPEREQRIINEGEYLRQVQGHPNIVEFSDCGRLPEHSWPWVTTELLRGEVLDWLLVRSKLEAGRIIDIAGQLAAALETCHAHGVVHRDITPGNLFVLEDGTVKLFDFSHAGDLRAPQLSAGDPGRLTGVHDTPGTIGYMGPEQAAKAPAQASMDVFGFGVLLFELITRRNPFRQFADHDEFVRAQREAAIEVPRIHAWAYEVPDELAAIVHDCTLRSVGDRPSIAEVVQRLAGIGAATTKRRRSRPAMFLLGMGAVVVIASGVGVGLVSHTEPTLPVTAPPVAEVEAQPAGAPPTSEPASRVSTEPGPRPATRCSGVETRGRAAFEQRRWREVVRHTARKVCWSSTHDRVKLRTTALFNLGRWGECAKLGARSHDPEISTIADACEARAKLNHLESK